MVKDIKKKKKNCSPGDTDWRGRATRNLLWWWNIVYFNRVKFCSSICVCQNPSVCNTKSTSICLFLNLTSKRNFGKQNKTKQNLALSTTVSSLVLLLHLFFFFSCSSFLSLMQLNWIWKVKIRYLQPTWYGNLGNVITGIKGR